MVAEQAGMEHDDVVAERPSSRASAVSVRTTPFTCGGQASVASRIFNSASASSRIGGRDHRVERAQRHPMQDLEPAVVMLDQRRAALDPVAVVAVKHAADVADLGMMDVAADDAVDAARAAPRRRSRRRSRR